MGVGCSVGRGPGVETLVLRGDVLWGCCARRVGLERSGFLRDTLCWGLGETTSGGG